jgi:hypothetical protein
LDFKRRIDREKLHIEAIDNDSWIPEKGRKKERKEGEKGS